MRRLWMFLGVAAGLAWAFAGAGDLDIRQDGRLWARVEAALAGA